MRKEFITLQVTAKNETAQAFLCSFEWEAENIVFSDMWIPKSVIHDSCHDEIEEAVAGETIEIHVAAWWLKQRL